MKLHLLLVAILLTFSIGANAQQQMNSIDLNSPADVDLKLLGNMPEQRGPVYNNPVLESLTPSEGFESATFPPTGWTWYTLNGDVAQRWLRQTSATTGQGAYGLSFSCAYFNAFNAANNTVQALQSPTFPPTAAGEVLRFDWHYLPYSGSQSPLATDSLVVQTSSDGGTTWNNLVIMWGDSTAANYFNPNHLITGTRSTSSAPTDVTWATKVLTLPVGTNCIRFKGHSQFGNNIFIDNIITHMPTSAMTGNFTIDAGQPSSATNFQTFRAAADSLNKRGISGPVNIFVAPGVYGAGNRFYLNPAGTSSTNKITFQNSGGYVVIADTGTASTNDYGIFVNGADWIVFDGINVRDAGTTTNGQVNRGYFIGAYRSLDGSRNVTVKNCNIVMGGGVVNPAAGSLGISVGGMNGGTTFPAIQEGSSDSLKVQSVRVQRSDRGIQIASPVMTSPAQTTTFTHRDVEISGCVLGDSITIGSISSPNPIAFLISGVRGLNMFNNRVDSCKNTSTTSTTAVTGMALQFCSGRAYNNVIRNLSHANLTSTAAIVTGIQGGPNSGEELYTYNNLIYNISRGYTGAANVTVQLKGIEATNFVGGAPATTLNYVYNNTILIDSTASPVTFTSAGINLFAAGLPVIVRNNNIINRLSTTALPAKSLAITDPNATKLLNANYNNFFAPGTNGMVGAWGTSLVNNNITLADWKTNYGGDTNSVSGVVVHSSIFPLTVDATVAGNWVLNGKGMPLSQVTTDINGAARNTLVTQGTTDIGADEVTMTVNPSFATQSAAPVASGTSVYTQFGDTVCIVTWGTGGTLPTGLNVMNLTGNNPPAPGTRHFLKTDVNVAQVGGPLAGTTYNMTLKYGSNQYYNTTNSATDLRVAKYDAGNWVTYTTPGTGNLQSELDAPNRRITVRGLSTFSDFTISDVTAPLTTLGLAPNLLLPANNATGVVPNSVLFRWNKSVEGTPRPSNNGKETMTDNVVNGYLFQLYTDTNSTPLISDSTLTASDTTKTTAVPQLDTLFWRVKAKNQNGYGPFSGWFRFITTFTIGIGSNEGLPTVFNLYNNYPNPFNPSTKIKFDIPQNSFVSLKVYDIAGRTVSTLVSENMAPGRYEATFDGSKFASGVYFYRINAGSYTKVVKMILTK